MRHYIWTAPDGEQMAGSTEGKLPKGATEIPRAPGAFERWNPDTAAFDHDAEGHADDIAGPAHIAAMRAQKAIEARLMAPLMAAGIDVSGLLLAREAKQLGVTAAELAATVLDKIAPAEALELKRQAASLTLNRSDK